MPEQNEQPNNAVLEVQLKYISKDISEIKSDVKEMKSDYVSRREFETRLSEVIARVSIITKILYTIASVIGLAILGALLKLVIIP